MAKRIHIPRGTPLKERLRLRSRPGPNGCVDFVGFRNASGYGWLMVDGRTMIASRASYEANIGPIPPGKHVLHSCDRPICINPDHLRLGTQADNMRDMVLKGRFSKKLTIEAVKNIRNDTRVQTIIAAEHGVTRALISSIKRGKVWRHVT